MRKNKLNLRETKLYLLRVTTLWHFQNIIWCFRSSRSQMFFKVGVLKSFAKFTWKHLCQSLFLKKFREIFKKTFSTERHWMNASDVLNLFHANVSFLYRLKTLENHFLTFHTLKCNMSFVSFVKFGIKKWNIGLKGA